MNPRSQAPKRMARITMELKKEIVGKYEAGMRVRDLAAAYGLPRTTTSTIIRNKEAIKFADVAKGVKSITKQRSGTLEQVEKLLLAWATERQRAGEALSEGIICEKARRLHADLSKAQPGSGQGGQAFKASHGWFDNFKRRSGIRTSAGPLARGEGLAPGNFAAKLRGFVAAEGYAPEQVFNCGETGLSWKRLPGVQNGEKDRLTLLLCANARGDCKVKPLLVCHPESSKEHRAKDGGAPVTWKSNPGGVVTRELFAEWFNVTFGPSVRNYLEEKKLPAKALLVLDKAPGHPPSLEDYVLHEFDFIALKFVPANATPLIRAMTRGVIGNFKKLYTKALLQRCFEATSGGELTLREFWKDHFDIIQCVALVDDAWKGVSRDSVNSSWRDLWPEAVDGGSHPAEPTVREIISLATSLGLNVTEGDVDELAGDALSGPGSEGAAEEASTSLIRDVLDKWTEVRNFADKHHPNRTQTSRNGRAWNDQTMSHFREILKRRQTGEAGRPEGGVVSTPSIRY